MAKSVSVAFFLTCSLMETWIMVLVAMTAPLDLRETLYLMCKKQAKEEGDDTLIWETQLSRSTQGRYG